jgi:hypothetical protein
MIVALSDRTGPESAPDLCPGGYKTINAHKWKQTSKRDTSAFN